MPTEIKKRIAELEAWLEANPNNPERGLIVEDVRKLNEMLNKKENV